MASGFRMAKRLTSRKVKLQEGQVSSAKVVFLPVQGLLLHQLGSFGTTLMQQVLLWQLTLRTPANLVCSVLLLLVRRLLVARRHPRAAHLLQQAQEVALPAALRHLQAAQGLLPAALRHLQEQQPQEVALPGLLRKLAVSLRP